MFNEPGFCLCQPSLVDDFSWKPSQPDGLNLRLKSFGIVLLWIS